MGRGVFLLHRFALGWRRGRHGWVLLEKHAQDPVHQGARDAALIVLPVVVLDPGAHGDFIRRKVVDALVFAVKRARDTAQGALEKVVAVSTCWPLAVAMSGTGETVRRNLRPGLTDFSSRTTSRMSSMISA